MNNELKSELEKITAESMEVGENVLKSRGGTKEDEEGSVRFNDIINGIIIPTIKKASWIIGRSGCSLNYYSNETSRISDPELRTVIQILIYPKGHSKSTLGVNVPFLQFAYSPSKKNVKITAKLSIKTDSARKKLNEININNFTGETFEKYLVDFLREVMTRKKVFQKD